MFLPVFLDFQFIDLSKMPLFPRKSAFYGFVLSNPHKRLSEWLCILLMVQQSRGARSLPIEPTRMQVMTFLDDLWHLAYGLDSRLAIFLDLLVDLPWR